MKGYLCSMQLDKERFELLLCIFDVSSKNRYFKLSPKFQTLYLLYAIKNKFPNDIVSTYRAIQRDLDVNSRSMTLTTLFDLRIVPSGARTPRHVYVSMICTGEVVTFYIYRNVICKTTASHLDTYSITMPTHCIYNYNGHRSECNRWFCV